jgi:hypothetical protein
MIFFGYLPIIARTKSRPKGRILREEECIPTKIPFDFLLIILVGVEILPHAGGENMLVPFVPTTINDFCEGWIVVCAFYFYLRNGFWGCFGFVRGSGKRIVGVEIDGFGSGGFRGWGRIRTIVE